jgi:hypothetical protein
LEVCRTKQVSLRSCAAFSQLTQCNEEKKVHFCELYHEHAMVESYSAYEPV